MQHLTIETRLAITESEGKRIISGKFPYQQYTDRRGKGEVIARSAFTNSLKSDRNIALLFNHNTADVVCTTRSGLELRDSETGLEFCYANASDQLVTRVKNECKGISVGFDVCDKGDYVSYYNGSLTRVIADADLFEISLVKNPQYDNTEIATRNRVRLLNKWR